MHSSRQASSNCARSRSPTARSSGPSPAKHSSGTTSRAENVSIFFADLFGYEERFNAPGTYNDVNWTLRLPPDFDRLHRERLDRGAALDIPLAIELVLVAPR